MHRWQTFPAAWWVLCMAWMSHAASTVDWLVDPSSFKARVETRSNGRELVLENGLVRRVVRLGDNAATVEFSSITTGETWLRAVKPEAMVEINGNRLEVGGLKGQPNKAFLRPAWLQSMTSAPSAFRYVGHAVGQPVERMPWRRARHHAPGVAWPPTGASLRLDFTGPPGEAEGVRVSVHYELYDGLPAYGKWITVSNTGPRAVRLGRYASDLLAAVERASEVDELSMEGRTPPALHVETDMSFGGMMATGANRRSYRWLEDPEFLTQVNYERRTPCLLEVGPDLGPGQDIPPGGSFESFRGWVIAHDSTDRERQGLSVRRFNRTLAPWTTENPLMLHLVSSDPNAVTNAIEQCAAVGFEMVILSFGSGFNVEDERPQNLERARAWSSHARSRGIEIGSYSLLASRSVGQADDVVMPPGLKPVFGNSPCLCSRWGTNYFRRLYEFHKSSGFTLLEHDGSYPGDPCASTQHPAHRSLDDSRWNQWRLISDFYRWCRAEGIYLNVPDHYFLSGSTKTGMGYREDNWSLPREQQVLHTRQNIWDGTWQKLPSMGWMFVPLTQYHGGGAAATIEPLDQHLDHYERMLASNLALGVQACYRGPRLFDTDRTREAVTRWVRWFKEHRDVLESDLVHGRRPDGRDVDWMLHVNPRGQEKGMLVVFNPLDEPAARTLRVNLHYTGLRARARMRDASGKARALHVGPDAIAEIPVKVPAGGMSWVALEAAR